MNTNEIERALCNDETIEPTREFASRVMGAVRREVGEREALAFPWRRLLPGLIASMALTVAALVFAQPLALSESTVRLLRDPVLIQSSTWVPTAILGTWLLIWGSLRFAGYRR